MSAVKKLFATLATTLALIAQVRAQSFLTNGLVAYYPFNGSANDVSGNGNNGAVYGATLTTNRFGTPSAAYRFDGVSSRIQIPETIFGPATPGATISAWVTTDKGPYTNTQVIWEKSSVNGEMTLQITSGQFVFGPALQNPHAFFTTSSAMKSNSVVHLVGVYAHGLTASLYVNGALTGSVIVSNSTLFVDTNANQLVSALGIYDFTPGPYDAFRGIIEDVRIYNRALSNSEVQQLYAYESVPPTCIPHSATATARVDNGFVVDTTITDTGCGYTNTPFILFEGGGGTGATATAVVSNGIVIKILITDAGTGYTNAPAIFIYSHLGTQIGLVKAVKPVFANLLVGANYQLQLSTDLINWTNQGSPFIPTNPVAAFPQYFDVTGWNQLFFRLGAIP
jgi:hypothetical protein